MRYGCLLNPEAAYAELVAAAARQKFESREVKMRKDAEPSAADLRSSINSSYFLLRRWIAIVALAMPALLWVAGLLITHSPVPQPSLSDYYYNPGDWARDIFVGSLCATGFFLYFYKGYTKVEDRVLNVAGVCAILVALAPMVCAGTTCDTDQHRLFFDVPFRIGDFQASLHQMAAVTLFLAVGYICIWQSGQTLKLIRSTRLRSQFMRTYRLLGTLMIALPLSAAALTLRAGRAVDDGIAVFLIEVAGMAVFGMFWLVKSCEIANILKL
jgi:uncharacterized membrane protein